MNREVFYMNQSMRKAFAVKNDIDLSKYKLFDFYTEKGKERIKSALAIIIKDGYWRGENEMQALDGRIMQVLQTIVLIKDEFGNPKYSSSTAIDITKEKQQADEIKASEKKYRYLLNSLNEGIVVHIESSEIIACNPAAERILGLTEDQMRGRTSIDPRWRSIHEDGSPFPGELHPAMETLRTKQALNNVIMGIYKPNEELAWISINSFPIKSYNGSVPAAVVATFSDITDRKNKEIELTRIREQLTYAMNQSHIAYWSMNAATQTFTFNDQFYKLYATTAEREGGYEMAANVYKREFVIPDQREMIKADIKRLISGKVETFEREHKILRRDGEIRDLIVRINVMKDEFGNVIGAKGSNQDITEQKRVEDRLRISESKFRAVLDNSFDAIGVYHNGIWEMCNPAALKLFGYAKNEELLGSPISNVIAKSEIERIKEYAQKRMNNEDAPTAYKTRGL